MLSSQDEVSPNRAFRGFELRSGNEDAVYSAPTVSESAVPSGHPTHRKSRSCNWQYPNIASASVLFQATRKMSLVRLNKRALIAFGQDQTSGTTCPTVIS